MQLTPFSNHNLQEELRTVDHAVSIIQRIELHQKQLSENAINPIISQAKQITSTALSKYIEKLEKKFLQPILGE